MSGENKMNRHSSEKKPLLISGGSMYQSDIQTMENGMNKQGKLERCTLIIILVNLFPSQKYFI